MRIHPSTGFILERLVPQGGVDLCHVHLPENTVVGVNAWVIHRNRAIFGTDVDVFRPERWIDSDPEMIKEMHRSLFVVSTIFLILTSQFLYPFPAPFLSRFTSTPAPTNRSDCLPVRRRPPHLHRQKHLPHGNVESRARNHPSLRLQACGPGQRVARPGPLVRQADGYGHDFYAEVGG